jgi:acyl dehydratase
MGETTRHGVVTSGVIPGRELWFEDFVPGQSFMLGRREVRREEMLRFACQYDPQPFHVDERAARATLLNGLSASGWHSCAMYMRLMSDGLLERCWHAGLFAMEEIRWLIPVRPGDFLSGRVTCIATSAPPWPGLGAVTFFCEALNGFDQRVMSWLANFAFQRRSGDDGAGRVAREQGRTSAVIRNPSDHGLKYFDDVRLGDEIAIGQYQFLPERIGAFSRDYDPWSAHPEAAPGRRCASGWHVAAIWMQRLIRYYLREAQRLRASGRAVPQLGPSPGIRHINWRRPVYAGDVVTFKSWAERKIDLPSKPEWGLLLGGCEGSNQHGEIVISFYATFLLERRQGARRLAQVEA